MVTNAVLIQKIKEQIYEAEKRVNDPVLFTETLKRVELLCELVTENKSEANTGQITEEMLASPKQSPSKQANTDLSGDSIFDF